MSGVEPIHCDVENGGMTITPDFIVGFGHEPNGPSRSHDELVP